MNANKLLALQAEREALIQSLKDLNAEEDRLKREDAEAESVSTEEAKSLIVMLTNPEGDRVQQKVFLRVARTLVALRAKPSNMTDKFLTWATPKDEDSMFPADQFSVSLEARNNEVYLNNDYDQVAHTLSVEEAELLGRRLLGAAEAGRRIDEQEKS